MEKEKNLGTVKVKTVDGHRYTIRLTNANAVKIEGIDKFGVPVVIPKDEISFMLPISGTVYGDDRRYKR